MMKWQICTARALKIDRWGPAAAIVGIMACAAVGGGGHCYDNYQRSCGALHANPGRVCVSGTVRRPCGDVVVMDAMVNDVRAGNERQGPIDTSCGDVNAHVHVFACLNGVCKSQGVNQLRCEGRCTEGPRCTSGGGGGVE